METTGIVASLSISTFYRSHSATPVSITDITQKRTLNIEILYNFDEDLYPAVEEVLQRNKC